jgi:hypothetical protein
MHGGTQSQACVLFGHCSSATRRGNGYAGLLRIAPDEGGLGEPARSNTPVRRWKRDSAGAPNGSPRGLATTTNHRPTPAFPFGPTAFADALAKRTITVNAVSGDVTENSVFNNSPEILRSLMLGLVNAPASVVEPLIGLSII